MYYNPYIIKALQFIHCLPSNHRDPNVIEQ
jgi:hypothetical protein